MKIVVQLLEKTLCFECEDLSIFKENFKNTLDLVSKKWKELLAANKVWESNKPKTKMAEDPQGWGSWIASKPEFKEEVEFFYFCSYKFYVSDFCNLITGEIVQSPEIYELNDWHERNKIV